MNVVGKAKEWIRRKNHRRHHKKSNVNELKVNLHKISRASRLIKLRWMTHLNSSNGKVVLGGSPGLNVTIRKKIEKLMRIEPSFLIKPIFVFASQVLRNFTLILISIKDWTRNSSTWWRYPQFSQPLTM